MATQSADTPPWAQALGRVPSGLFVVTVAAAAGETGMLASWVQQCSFDPPQLTFAVRKGRYLLDWLTPDTPFAVNVIGEGQKALVAHFGKGFEPGEGAFAGLKVSRPAGEAPVLADALATVQCRAVGHADGGDHVLVIGRVVGGVVHHDGRPTVHVRRNATHY